MNVLIAVKMGAPPARPINVDHAPLSQITRDRRSSVKMFEDADRVGAQFGHKPFATRYRACK